MGPVVRVASGLAGVCSLAAAIVCFAVAELAVEESEGFYLTLGGRRYELPSNGMLGDAGTYFAEWGILGYSCLGAAALFILLSRVRDPARRRLVVGLLVPTLAAVVLFAADKMR
jgi:hypothetical protein